MIRIDVEIENHGNYLLWKPAEWVTVCISRNRHITNPDLLGRDASNQAAWILDSC